MSVTVKKDDPDSYFLWRSREEKLAASAQDLLDIVTWVEQNRKQLEEEALEAWQEELQRRARRAGKNDPMSKCVGGFDLVKHGATLYLHHPCVGKKDLETYEQWETLERWRWNGMSWRTL